MGAGISGFASDRGAECVSRQWKTGLGDIPDSCISLILASLDPPEICKLARVNRAFHAASSVDFVWESKLPSNYRFLVRRVLGENPDHLSKKEVYSRLCQASCFDGGTKEFWLDKISGDICLCVSSKALKITGIDDRRYWNYIATDGSRKRKVPEERVYRKRITSANQSSRDFIKWNESNRFPLKLKNK